VTQGNTSILIGPFLYAVDDLVFCCVTPLVGLRQNFTVNYQWFHKQNRWCYIMPVQYLTKEAAECVKGQIYSTAYILKMVQRNK
jgi:hypothetical protein